MAKAHGARNGILVFAQGDNPTVCEQLLKERAEERLERLHLHRFHEVAYQALPLSDEKPSLLVHTRPSFSSTRTTKNDSDC